MESHRALAAASLTTVLSWVALLVPDAPTLLAVAGGIGLCAAAALFVLSLLLVQWQAASPAHPHEDNGSRIDVTGGAYDASAGDTRTALAG